MLNKKKELTDLNEGQMRRLIKDFNLPMSKYTSKGLFNYYRDLYKSFFPYDAEKTLLTCSLMSDGIDKYNEKINRVTNEIIEEVTNSERYKKFNSTKDVSLNANGKTSIEHLINVPKGDVYNGDNDGKLFLSIDLQNANFQALSRYGANVLDYNSYEKFIIENGGDPYMAASKQIRQVLFGKMNPNRIVTVEKLIMDNIYDALINETVIGGPWEYHKLYKVNNDEIIFSVCKRDGNSGGVNMHRSMLNAAERGFENIVWNKTGFFVTAEYFEVKKLDIVNDAGSSIDAYVKKSLVSGRQKLKKTSTIFYPQVYKLMTGQEITVVDRFFYYENNIARFDTELKFREKNDKSYSK